MELEEDVIAEEPDRHILLSPDLGTAGQLELDAMVAEAGLDELC